MSEDLRNDPAYAEGFWDAQAGEPLFDDADPAYAAGWRACHECREILERNGFTRTGPANFNKTTILRGDHER